MVCEQCDDGKLIDTLYNELIRLRKVKFQIPTEKEK
jgi:hypothetical protein